MKDEIVLMDILNKQPLPDNTETLDNILTINRYCQCLFNEKVKEDGEFDFEFIKSILCYSIMYGYWLGKIESKREQRKHKK